MICKPIEKVTKVRHRQDGYVGFIDGLTEICKCPKRNSDGRTQYRVRVEGKEFRELATADDLEILKRAPRKDERSNVYVVQLKGIPGGTGKDVYVGMTGLTPEERYANHKMGYKAGKKIVTRYGVKLLPELYDHLNPKGLTPPVVLRDFLAEQFEKSVAIRVMEIAILPPIAARSHMIESPIVLEASLSSHRSKRLPGRRW